MAQRIEVTPDLVRGLWAHLGAEYGSNVIQKDDSKNMAAIGWFLDTIGVMDKERFLKGYATTLFDDIYIPFTIGDPRSAPLWSQAELGVHEHQHVYQAQEEGAIIYAASYLGKKSGRAHWEAAALRCNVEMYYWQYGKIPGLLPYAKKILHYGCGDAEVAQIYEFLKMSAVTILDGGVISHASQVAIRWLEKQRR